MAKIWILGSGGFGTSLAVNMAANGNQVVLWSLFEEEIETLRADREHKKLLPGVKIPEQVCLTSSLDGVGDADLVIMAVPSFAVRDTARLLQGRLPDGKIIVNIAKGLEKGTLSTLAEVIEEELPKAVVAALSGPSHAEEVARGVPTTVVVASRHRESVSYVQEIMMNPTLRIYENDDVPGVELGGALKNIIALAAGVCDGLGLGDNAKAALMTRGITEIARLGVKLGARTETFAGLSGIGDLIVTCTSMHSRNRRTGILIGEGYTVEDAIAKVGMTVEGYISAKSAYVLAQRTGTDMPIIEQTYQVLYEGKSPRQAINDLMTRPKKCENEVVWLTAED